MKPSEMALGVTDNLPIQTQEPVKSGKVRSVYWLDETNSNRLINERRYDLMKGTQLGVMIISDKISSFDVTWKGEEGLLGVPGKGAALNAISEYWFNELEKEDGFHHLIETPHPLVWIVPKAEQIKIEAIARQYITGSMWRAYEKGERVFCGIELPNGLQKNQRLDSLLITPTTKDIMYGLEGIKEEDDTNITKKQIQKYWKEFGFKEKEGIVEYEELLLTAFNLITDKLEQVGELFVDTKIELGYITDSWGVPLTCYIDEIGTPDSSRMWDKNDYETIGKVTENSKEPFRNFLQNESGLPKEILLGKDKAAKKALSEGYEVPLEVMMTMSKLYNDITQKITGQPVPKVENAREEILEALQPYGILK